MDYSITIRTVTYNLDTGEKLRSVDSAPIPVSEKEMKMWLETGRRPWERRLEKEAANAR